jgi:Xaa-Pro aminopeptidase
MPALIRAKSRATKKPKPSPKRAVRVVVGSGAKTQGKNGGKAPGGVSAIAETPPHVYARRIDRLSRAAFSQRVDHVLITNPLDVGYLTGFLGGESYLLIGPTAGPKNALLLSDGRYAEELRPFSSILDVYIRSGSMDAAVADVLSRPGVNHVAVQAEHLTLAGRDDLVRAIGHDRGDPLVPIRGLVAWMRETKDPYECEIIQAATTLQERALLAIKGKLKPGMEEQEIAAMLESELKRRGSSKCWFETIVAAKANGSLPHYRPGAEKTAAGQPLLIDWGATYRGYGGDMTRTFCFGKWPKKIREIYEIVKDAQEMAAAALAPGKTTIEIDALARDHIAKHGYGDHFDHGLGHGLGMSKEPPYLNPKNAPMELQVGHVCTIEPGIYLPGVGGVRIEDLYVITENGARNFCSLPKTLEWSTL